MDSIIKEKNLNIFYKRRENLDSTRIELNCAFDKYLLTFATGALYLTILYFNSNKTANSKIYLYLGCILLLITIILTLLSLSLSSKAFEREIQITDSQINALQDEKKLPDLYNPWNSVISVLNILSIPSFCIGLSFLTFFYLINF